MFHLRSVIKLVPKVLAIAICLNSCTEKEIVKEKPKDQLKLSADVAELINDTASVSPLIDSLKNEFQYSSSKKQINILGELAENWRPFSYYLATEELEQSKKLSYKIGESDALCKFGIYYVRKFNFDSANYYLAQAGSMSALSNELTGILAQSLSWKAEVQRNSGEIDKCLKLQDEAIGFSTKANDQKRLAFCYISKGEAYRIQGEFNKAIECYNKSISFATPINDLNKITICYNSLGDVYRTQNNYPKALEYFNKGLDIAKKNKNKTQIAFCLSCLGDIYNTQGEYPKALSYYEDANKIAVEMGLKLQECQSLSSIGMTYYLQNKKEEALSYFDRSVKIAEEIGNKDKMSFAYSLMADIYAKQHNTEKALECYAKSIDISAETGNKAQLTNTYNQLGDFYFNQKKYSEAKKMLKRLFNWLKKPKPLKESKHQLIYCLVYLKMNITISKLY